jgi:predicted small lipoprotein YifL
MHCVMNYLSTVAFTTAVLAALAGCGQMGPLYMPPPEEKTASEPAQSPQPPQPDAVDP